MESKTSAIDNQVRSPSSDSSPRIELNRVPDISLPEKIPDGEVTLYLSDGVTLRMRPDGLAHRRGSVCVTMYMKITDETEHLIPEKAPYWDNKEYTQSATTEEALPDNLQRLYEAAIKQVERQFNVSRIQPRESYGICHRKHESVGRYGIVSIETRFN